MLFLYLYLYNYRLVILNGTTGRVKSMDGRGDVARLRTPRACVSHWTDSPDIDIPETSVFSYCSIL